jgi:hypothetical protein
MLIPISSSSPVNRISNLFGNLMATGDDEGVIKVRIPNDWEALIWLIQRRPTGQMWDHRQKQQIREFGHHWEYISDFMFLDDKKQLVSTSYVVDCLIGGRFLAYAVCFFCVARGDGTLSVIDVRANTTTPLAVSEDQDDELLSIVSIKG